MSFVSLLHRKRFLELMFLLISLAFLVTNAFFAIRTSDSGFLDLDSAYT